MLPVLLNAASVVVTGLAFSGISTMVVVPPAAAACVAVSNPLPVGLARLVDMHVRIDHTGHDDVIAKIFGARVLPARMDVITPSSKRLLRAAVFHSASIVCYIWIAY